MARQEGPVACARRRGAVIERLCRLPSLWHGALSVGVLLLIPLEILLQGVGTWKEQLTETLGMLLLFGVLPAAVGAAIGTYYHQTLSPWLEQWLPR